MWFYYSANDMIWYRWYHEYLKNCFLQGVPGEPGLPGPAGKEGPPVSSIDIQ